MSKAIAQTVGGKRMYWLVALLAAFAVLAGASQLQTKEAKAIVTGANFTLTSSCSGVVPVGTVCNYTLTIAPLSQATFGALIISMELNPGLGNITNIDTSGFAGANNTACTVFGTNNRRIDCSYPPFVSAGASGIITFSATALFHAILADQCGICGPLDNGVASFSPMVDNTGALTIQGAALTITKQAVGPSGGNGGNIGYIITLSNAAAAADIVAATNARIDDLFDDAAFQTVQSISCINSGGGGVAFSVFPFATPVGIFCSTGLLNPGESLTLFVTITLDAFATPAPGDPPVCVNLTNFAVGTANNALTVTSNTTNTQYCGPSGAALPSLAPGLYHVNPSGTALLTDGGIALRDEFRNLVGWDHVVCLVIDPNDGEQVEFNDDLEQFGGIQPPNANGIPRWRIDTISGASNVQGQAKLQLSFPGFDNTTDLNCVRWYSTGVGEQNVTIVDSLGQVSADWANGGGNDVCDNWDASPGPMVCNDPLLSYTALIKEWNKLDGTGITVAGTALTAATNLDGKAIDRPATFNPATSKFQGASITLAEHIFGSHQSAGGTVGPVLLNGASGTIKVTGTCGSVTVDGTTIHPTYGSLAGGGTLDVGESGTYVSIGVPVKFTVTTGEDCSSLNNSYTIVTFLTGYFNELGSLTPSGPIETVRINWKATLAAKQILLAWVGQRIILEHDWRIPAGDKNGGASPDPTPLGECPYELGPFWSKFLKGSGPGTFLPGSDLVGLLDPIIDLISPDEANVNTDNDNVQDDDDIDANSACISRVLYQSQEPGAVTIDLFAESGVTYSGNPNRGLVFDNQSKVGFVVYYMKFNSVKLSIVGDRSKPTHNSSLDGLSDYAAGNPWDASKDVTTIDWNVSKDLLIRGRVTGFLNTSNPSGRAADASDPLNVLPADRWVLPTDWALLAGGPGDPADGSDASGTAEQFRPYYDLLFAPNNTAGLALVTPAGGLTQVASVVAFPAGGLGGGPNATTFAVSSISSLPAGASVFVGASLRVIASSTAILNGAGNVVGVRITLTAPLAATPAVGTPISLVTAPFEGPYSLIDIPGLAGAGFGGAALSNLVPNDIRDTILRDGDVDMWDAPMPVALISIKLRGTGFLKQVIKSDVYYNGTPNSSAQNYPNPFYISNVPDSQWIPAVNAGGGYDWDSWALDGPGGLGQGPYQFWNQIYRDRNSAGIGEALTNTQRKELQAIRDAFGDQSITRDTVVYSDNHGEFMVTANGDFLTDLSACASNVLGGGKHCKPGDKVGTGTVTATADYPDFRGNHFPVASNSVTANWTWGGYKDVTIEKGEDPQFSYVVFHALDRDAACFVDASTGRVSLHPVWTGDVNNTFNGNPSETIDFLIDSGEGIILSAALGGDINKSGNRQFANGVGTFSTLLNDPAATGIKEFPLSALAPAGSVDECQAWIKVSNSLLGILNVLVIAHNDEGDVGFDRIVDFQTTATYTLNFRWSLITWNGADNIPVADALKGVGANDAGNDIFDQVTAIYGWNADAQDWLGYFPAGVSVPGANDLVGLKRGQAYWIAIVGPASVTWTYATNVGA